MCMSKSTKRYGLQRLQQRCSQSSRCTASWTASDAGAQTARRCTAVSKKSVCGFHPPMLPAVVAPTFSTRVAAHSTCHMPAHPRRATSHHWCRVEHPRLLWAPRTGLCAANQAPASLPRRVRCHCCRCYSLRMLAEVVESALLVPRRMRMRLAAARRVRPSAVAAVAKSGTLMTTSCGVRLPRLSATCPRLPRKPRRPQQHNRRARP